MPDGLEKLAMVLFVVFVFGGSTVGYVVRELAGRWRDVRVSEQNAAIKKEMLDRGFTAEDIIRVVTAGDIGAAARPDLIVTLTTTGYDADALVAAAAALDKLPPAGRDDAMKAAIGMAENSYSAADVVKFLESRCPPAVRPHQA